MRLEMRLCICCAKYEDVQKARQYFMLSVTSNG